jgi:hypothetical protein
VTSPELEKLVAAGALRREPPTAGEVEGLIRSGRARLGDARKPDLTLESRFDLAYNAGHSLALAALRRMGYRSTNRYLVFQVLPHTLGLAASVWRVLVRGHEQRNFSEYGGAFEIDERLVGDIIVAVDRVLAAIDADAASQGGARSGAE